MQWKQLPAETRHCEWRESENMIEMMETDAGKHLCLHKNIIKNLHSVCDKTMRIYYYLILVLMLLCGIPFFNNFLCAESIEKLEHFINFRPHIFHKFFSIFYAFVFRECFAFIAIEQGEKELSIHRCVLSYKNKPLMWDECTHNVFFNLSLTSRIS